MTVVLGHQGGWDEILIFLGALCVVYVIGFCVWLVTRRGDPDAEPTEQPSKRVEGDHRSRLEERRRINEQARRKDPGGSS